MKRIVWGKAYLVNENYRNRIKVGGWLRGVSEFIINPPENSWTITVELIAKDAIDDFCWVRVFFPFYDTAPQELLFSGQEVYLTDGPSRIFQIWIVDDAPEDVKSQIGLMDDLS